MEVRHAASESPEQIARERFDEARRQRKEKIRDLVHQAVTSTPQRALVMESLLDCPALDGNVFTWDNKAGELKQAAESLFSRLLKFDDAAVLALGEDLQKQGKPWSNYRISDMAAPLLNRVYEALGIKGDIPPEPTLEDFLPPPEPAKEKSAKGKKGTAQAKASKPRKPSGGRKGKAAAAGMDLDDDAEGGDA